MSCRHLTSVKMPILEWRSQTHTYISHPSYILHYLHIPTFAPRPSSPSFTTMPTPFAKLFLSMNKAELQEVAQHFELDAVGTMNALRTRIRDHLIDEDFLHNYMANDNYVRLYPTRFRNGYTRPTTPDPQAPSQHEPSPPWNGIQQEPPSPPQHQESMPSISTASRHSSSSHLQLLPYQATPTPGESIPFQPQDVSVLPPLLLKHATTAYRQ